jgi:hypothetical protein
MKREDITYKNRPYGGTVLFKLRDSGGPMVLTGTWALNLYVNGSTVPFAVGTVANGKIAVDATSGIVTRNFPASDFSAVLGYGSAEFVRTDISSRPLCVWPLRIVKEGTPSIDPFNTDMVVYSNNAVVSIEGASLAALAAAVHADAVSVLTSPVPVERLPTQWSVLGEPITNWNTMWDNGFYYSAPGALGAPNSTEWFNGHIEVCSNSATYACQIIRSGLRGANPADTGSYIRFRDNVGIGPWQRMWTTERELDARYQATKLIVESQGAPYYGGGNSISGTQQRFLNAVIKNAIPGASVSSNFIFLPPGTYNARYMAVGGIGNHRVALYNYSATAYVGLGSSMSNAAGCYSESEGLANFTLTSTSGIGLNHYFSTASTNGLGPPTGAFGNECFGRVEIW